MDRISELAERIKARAQEEKEKTKCAKFTDVKLEGTAAIKTGFTKKGRRVYFESCNGMTDQSKYGAGTLSVEIDGKWEVIFTKGYPSKALAYMMNN